MNFLPHVEKKLCKEIKDEVKLGHQISRELVAEKSRKLYYESWNVAERATYQLFVDKGMPIYCDDDDNYTEDFIEQARTIQDMIEDLNDIKETIAKIEVDEEEKIKSANEILHKYKIPMPKFSDKWITDFMKRNRLSWRKAHYARRSAIDQQYASIYLDILAEAVCKYRWANVFNMDETSVRINNGSIRTIAPIGLNEIVIDAKRNDKECFTAIGTCTILERKNLFC